VRNEPALAIASTASFKYGPDRARFKRVDDGTGGDAARTCKNTLSDRIFCHGFEDGDVNPSAPIGTITYYVGNVEFTAKGGVDTVKRYLGGYLVVTTSSIVPTPSFDYLLRDGLGSVDAIVSETGQVRQRLAFDAHGSRRYADPPGGTDLWSLLVPEAAANVDTSRTTRGYTGHEQLDGVGLVHMNGRLYDPAIGRFIQADPLVEPDATQGLNRYTYALNNPLTYTDPSGYLTFRQVLGIAVGVAFAIVSGDLWNAGNFIASFFTAVAGGFASAGIATGSLRAAAWGAVSAAVFWGIGSGFNEQLVTRNVDGAVTAVREASSGARIAKIAAHAGAGGTLNDLQGGKFGHGFVSAGVTEWLSPAVSTIGGEGYAGLAARTVVSATIGGTVSEITGGSFGAGAATAAFQQLFNAGVHDALWRSAEERVVQALIADGVTGVATQVKAPLINKGNNISAPTCSA
jgi:RHS repeat-associated protein